jgi:AhpD family alkylhydroperoxidase
MAFRSGTARPLNDLVEHLPRAPNRLWPGGRELIASYVSYLNDCRFCQSIHGAIAAVHLDGDEELVRRVRADFKYAAISQALPGCRGTAKNASGEPAANCPLLVRKTRLGPFHEQKILTLARKHTRARKKPFK